MAFFSNIQFTLNCIPGNVDADIIPLNVQFNGYFVRHEQIIKIIRIKRNDIVPHHMSETDYYWVMHSHQRRQAFTAVTTGHTTSIAIRDAYDMSRTEAGRALRQLTDRGLLEVADRTAKPREYELTEEGERVAEAVASARESLEA